MRPPVQAYAIAVLVLILGTGLSGCVTPSQPETSTETPLASCNEIMPGRVAQNVFGKSAEVVQLHESEADAVDPLVDSMVNDGIACGGIIDDVAFLDGAVLIGQLAMDEDQWAVTQSEFAADGHEAVDEIVEGWVYVSKPGGDPTIGSGFAWRDGVLYYVLNPFVLGLLPPFASEFTEGAPLA
ncbi:hypothetical protein [Cryobacterium sp. Y29]|uniref:hypothetical protein n=1 Tax=Cryobacterium sp. Y29 TaxID=2048285 RepID=UPI0011B0663D|nr:hypothetical protein [Cryobacterium sp. Y29]